MRYKPMRSSGNNSGKASWWLKSSAIGVLVFLHFPILLILLYAFNVEDSAYSFPPPGLTFKWIPMAFSNPDLLRALLLSVEVAIIATSIALVLGTLAASAVYSSEFFGREAISFFLVLPIALPGIVTGIALRSAIGGLGIPFSFWTIVIGHATFCVVTVYNNVLARFRRTGGSMIEASMDLGADTFETFRHIILPNIATALLAGGILAFSLSFDEVIVTTFTAGQQETLPIWILGQILKPRDRPLTNVAAMLVVILTTIPILIAQKLTSQAGDTEGS